MIIGFEGTVALGTAAVPGAWGLGGVLALAVAGAALEAMSPHWLPRTWGWVLRALSVALRGLYVALGLRLAYRLAVTYLHLGWRGQAHTWVRRGRHRPEYVKAHPWRPVRTWSVTA